MHHTHRIGALGLQAVYTVRVSWQNACYIYVLAVHRHKERVFKRMLASPLHAVDFTQFGRVLFSGKGTMLDAAAAAMLSTRYGIALGKSVQSIDS